MWQTFKFYVSPWLSWALYFVRSHFNFTFLRDVRRYFGFGMWCKTSKCHVTPAINLQFKLTASFYVLRTSKPHCLQNSLAWPFVCIKRAFVFPLNTGFVQLKSACCLRCQGTNVAVPMSILKMASNSIIQTQYLDQKRKQSKEPDLGLSTTTDFLPHFYHIRVFASSWTLWRQKSQSTRSRVTPGAPTCS